MERVRASVSAGGKRRFIYLGDGIADFCSGLKLGEGDFLMPRKNYPVWEIICGNPKMLKANISEWDDGEELERILLHWINTINMEDKCNTRSDKFQATSMDSHQSFQSVLPVPH